MNLKFETLVPLPYQTIKNKFDKELFIYLSPDIIPFKLKRFDGCRLNDEIHILLGMAVIKQEWISIITDEKEADHGWYFVDEGKKLPWPLKTWKHVHRVDRLGDQESRIVDDITYDCGNEILNRLMKPFLWSVFVIRPGRYHKFFQGLK